MGPVRQRCTRPHVRDCCVEHEDFLTGAELSALRTSCEGPRVVELIEAAVTASPRGQDQLVGVPLDLPQRLGERGRQRDGASPSSLRLLDRQGCGPSLAGALDGPGSPGDRCRGSDPSSGARRARPAGDRCMRRSLGDARRARVILRQTAWARRWRVSTNSPARCPLAACPKRRGRGSRSSGLGWQAWERRASAPDDRPY